jgi:hypothetical protein
MRVSTARASVAERGLTTNPRSAEAALRRQP